MYPLGIIILLNMDESNLLYVLLSLAVTGERVGIGMVANHDILLQRLKQASMKVISLPHFRRCLPLH